jgi:regulator of sigma E protease
MGTSIFAMIILLGVLIFFHELGHFLVARLFGVGVETFSLGFGPRIFGKKIGITDYRISALPLGGFVKMIGEDPDAEIDPEDIPISFTHKHPLKRILIVAAGPFFNIVLTIIIFFGIFLASGTHILKPSIGEVTVNSPAENAGLKKGDLITAIGDVSVSRWDELTEIISKSQGKNIRLSITREKLPINVTIQPKLEVIKNMLGEDTKRYLIGISPLGEFLTKDLNPLEAFGESVTRTYEISRLLVIFVGKLIQGKISAKDALGGPIMIASMAGQQAKAGMIPFLFFIGFISINLAILNLIPLPPLDGGHLLFFSIELIIRKPVNLKVREIVQMAGIFLLVTLMIYVIYSDIMRFDDVIVEFFRKAKGLFN